MLLAVLAVSSVGCGDNLTPDVVLQVGSPPRGAVIDGREVIVNGRATSATWGLSRVEVNGQIAALDDLGRFEIMLSLDPGTSIIETVAFGRDGFTVTDRRAISAGGLVQASAISEGLVLRMGSRGLHSQATAIRTSLDINGVYDDVKTQPLKSVGTDCPRDVVTATDVSTPVTSLYLFRFLSGFAGEVLLTNLAVSYVADYTDASCAPQSGELSFQTLEMHWRYGLEISLDGPAEQPFVVSISDSMTLYDHELIYTNVDIDPVAFGRMQDLHEFLAPRLVELLSAEISLKTASALNALGQDATISVDGVELVTAAIPERLLDDGADSLALSFASETRASASLGPVFVPTPMPARLPSGFHAALTISDDALDQALGVAWRAGMFDVELPSGGEMELLVPPVVKMSEEGVTAVIVGDWIAALPGAEVSLTGQLVLGPDSSTDRLRLAPGEATLEPNMIEGSISGAVRDQLIEEAALMLRDRVETVLSGLGLPVAAHAADQLTVSGGDGYVEISIDLGDL